MDRSVDKNWLNKFMFGPTLRKLSMHPEVPDFISPTELTIDLEKLRIDIKKINMAVGHNFKASLTEPNRQVTLSLTYPKNIPDELIEKYGIFRARFVGPLAYGEESVRQNYNLSTADFTEMDLNVKFSYVKTVADEISRLHSEQNRPGKMSWIHCGSLAPGSGFGMHCDEHCVGRYHVALYTNDYSYVMVEQLIEQDFVIKAVHIPADGRVWYLDTNILHSAVNLSPITQEENIRSHLIFSFYD